MPHLNFMRRKWIYALISGTVIIPGIISLLLWRLNPAVDFTGGSLWEVKFDKNIDTKSLYNLLSNEGVDPSPIQKSGTNQYLLRFKNISEEKRTDIKNKVEGSFGQFIDLRFETVGPTLGKELLIKTLIGVVLASFSIMLYVGWQFKNRIFGISAILAMFHDSLVVIGIFSLLGHFFNVEVDTLFVTALLTVLSFSVHDTVVVYDRIRESSKNNPKANFNDLANKAITETLARSLNNSLTIIFMLTALVALGGVTIRWFAVALLIGTISGTYSSPFVAVPILTLWHTRSKNGEIKYI